MLFPKAPPLHNFYFIPVLRLPVAKPPLHPVKCLCFLFFMGMISYIRYALVPNGRAQSTASASVLFTNVLALILPEHFGERIQDRTGSFCSEMCVFSSLRKQSAELPSL